jgi:hypothetical protein
MLTSEPVVFTEASTVIRAGRCRVAGIDVHEDNASAAVAAFCLTNGSVSGTEYVWVEMAADTDKHLDFKIPIEFPGGCYLKGSPTGQFTGAVRFV